MHTHTSHPITHNTRRRHKLCRRYGMPNGGPQDPQRFPSMFYCSGTSCCCHILEINLVEIQESLRELRNILWNLKRETNSKHPPGQVASFVGSFGISLSYRPYHTRCDLFAPIRELSSYGQLLLQHVVLCKTSYLWEILIGMIPFYHSKNVSLFVLRTKC